MKNTTAVLCRSALFAGAMLAFAPAQAVNITVYASSAPNAFGSPSFPGWVANTQCFLQGSCTAGDRDADPAAFESLTTFEPGDAMVTSYHSWRGQADPGTVFGSAFASELGNRMHFPVIITSDSGADTFTLADVGFEIDSPDGGSSGFGGSGALGYSGDLSGTTLNGSSRVGVFWGGDGAPGGGDDVVYTGGESDATLLNVLYYVGVGNALWPMVPDDGATEQEALDSVAASFYSDGISSITGSYSVRTASGSAAVRLASVPEPGTLGIFGLGLLGLCAATRLRRRPLPLRS